MLEGKWVSVNDGLSFSIRNKLEEMRGDKDVGHQVEESQDGREILKRV